MVSSLALRSVPRLRWRDAEQYGAVLSALRGEWEVGGTAGNRRQCIWREDAEALDVEVDAKRAAEAKLTI
jgi:hypothetical protein